MKELKISKEAVLEASETCPDAKEVLKALFPDVFKEGVDISKEIEWKFRKGEEGYGLLELWYEESLIGHTYCSGEFFFCDNSDHLVKKGSSKNRYFKVLKTGT